MLSRIESKNLTVFVVWVPRVKAKRNDVPLASRIIDDPRTRQYWDGSYVTGAAFENTLEIGEPAWDVYMAYGRGIRWTGNLPPHPTFWMHQLGVTNAPRLDPDVFAAHVNDLLAG